MATIDRYVSQGMDVKGQRSIFTMTRRTATSYFHGYLHPVGVPIEVNSGDTWKAKLKAFVEMSTPVRPIMDNIRCEVDLFYVPRRVLWNKTKLFYGEADTFGIAEKVDEPYMTVNDSSGEPLKYRNDFSSNLEMSETFGASFGLIREDETGDICDLPINTLPIRAFLACYNEYYRDQNYQDQYKWDMDETDLVDAFAYLGETTIDANSMLPRVNKDKDVFISILPWAQKGDPVTISLGDTAPVDIFATPTKYGPLDLTIGYDDTLGESHLFNFLTDSGLSGDAGDIGVSLAGDPPLESGQFLKYRSGLSGTADLSQATPMTINALIYALAMQDFLTRAGHYGTKYKEYIYSMFNTVVPDLTQDIPEYLGRLKFNININRVFSTVEQGQGLGEVGAYSVSGDQGLLSNKTFAEPGWLVPVVYTKHQRTYSSGIDKVFLKHELFDYFQKPFGNIGDQPVSAFELFAGGDNVPLGFQEPWYDYHALQDRVYGVLNPLMPRSLANWTLAERFIEQPTINGEFLCEDRTAMIDALVSGENGPDYIMDFEFSFEATRVMPLFSTNKLGSF